MFDNQMHDQLQRWYVSLSTWQRAAAHIAFSKREFTDEDIQPLVNQCLAEVGLVEQSIQPPKTSLDLSCFFTSEQRRKITLDSLSAVKGVGALEVSKSLLFDKDFTIIYGGNGSGKSSYIGLLKNICDSKGKQPILGNVYKKVDKAASAELSLIINGTSQSIQWTDDGSSSLPELHNIQIYDTNNANLYVDEGEVVFEPELLSCLARLVEIFDQVSLLIDAKMDACTQKIPESPTDLPELEKAIVSYSIKHSSDSDSLFSKIILSKTESEEREALVAATKDDDPCTSAKNIRSAIAFLNTLSTNFLCLYEKLNDENILRIKAAYISKQTAEKAVDLAANEAFSEATVEGVGNHAWKSLWEKAREYSTQYAYPNVIFPNTANNSVCILCHQPLSAEAKVRMRGFEDFVTCGLENNRKQATETLGLLLKQLPEIPKADSLELGLTQHNLIDCIAKIKGYLAEMTARKAALIEWVEDATIPEISSKIEIESYITQKVTQLEIVAKKYEETIDDYQKQVEYLHSLHARKWLSQNPTAITERVVLEKLKKARSSTNTGTVSKQKSALAEKLITDEYIERFQKELCALGANKIKVQLVKSKVSKGRTYHKIVLIGAAHITNTQQVLSEGEFRAVSLAAFIAETDTSQISRPIIFDDPISSLDHDFEERVARRLVDLSSERQVIVFTHRIAFAQILFTDAEDRHYHNKLIGLRSDPLGEPEDSFPLVYQRMDKALNAIINQEIPALRSRKANCDYDGADDGTIALCNKIRKINENGIEEILFHGIVRRFNREVQTQKLRYLFAITPDDIEIFSEIMTKYSFEVHSQPGETPRLVPRLDEIETDMKSIYDRLKDFQLRQKQYD